MFMPPENIAAAPTPATALPTMSIVEFTAAPHSTDPISKITRAIMYVHFTLKYVYILPKEGCRDVVVRR